MSQLSFSRQQDLNGSIGVLGPIDLFEFRNFLNTGVPDGVGPRGMGGTPVTLLCKELLRRGRQLAIFTLDPNIEHEWVFEGNNLRIHFIPYATRDARNFFKKQRQELRNAIDAENPICLHAHFTYEYALAAIDSGRSHVVTAHDATLNCLRGSFIPFKGEPIANYYSTIRAIVFRTIHTIMAYRVTRAAQRLIAVSPHVVDHLHRWHFRSGPIDVIPNGMPSASFERRCKSQPSTAFTFATVLSYWGSIKNGAAAIEAFAKVRSVLPDARLLMFGPGHSADGPGARWARENGLSDGIEFIGQLPNAHVIDSLAGEVDVLVHPALEEAHPMPLIEAMSLGIPVIGGRDAGGVPWTLGDGKYGLLVDVRSPEQIAMAMLTLAQNRDFCRELGAAGRKFAKRHFHIENVADQYEHVYAKLSSQSTPRPASPKVSCRAASTLCGL
jgi:L-malate glycosyltransferase